VSSNPVIAQWWFHLPNFVLAALMYTLLGRLMLSFFFDPQSRNYIWRAFVRLTDPVLKAVAYVTPRSVPPIVVLLFAFVWLLAARIVFLTVVANLGALPATGVSGS
jgi:YggT family protein